MVCSRGINGAWYRISAGPSVTHHLRGGICLTALSMICSTVMFWDILILQFAYFGATLTSNLGILEKIDLNIQFNQVI